MKILQFTAENVKKLSVVEITPKGHMVVVGGANGAGKTSVLDGIMYALAGKTALPPKPLRDGTKAGRVELKLDGDDERQLSPLTVVRTFTEKGTALEITTDDGYKAPSPQAILDDLCGRVAFDPLSFTRLAPKAQADALRELVGLDFSKQDAKRAKLYAERTIINREQKRLEGIWREMPTYPEAPDKEVSVSDLSEELTRRMEANEEKAEQQRSLQKHAASNEELHKRAHGACARVSALEAELVEARSVEKATADEAIADDTELARRRSTVDAMPTADTLSVREQIADAERVNAQIAANREADELQGRVEDGRKDSDTRTNAIDAIDQAKAKAMADADWPVKGLGFDDTGVTFEGLAFVQASSAEQLRISVAMGFAVNPTLRTLLIRDGSLLDHESLALLGQLAQEKDGQLWIERVGHGNECSVIIEDGRLAAASTENVPATD